jgi:uncharacterized protein YcgI (DUF1989 family)
VEYQKKIVIRPQTGSSFIMKKGQRIRVIDLEGKQVADLVAFNLADKKEKLSTAVTIDNNSSLNILIGDCLFSNQYNKLLKVVADTVKKHDLLYPACSPAMYRNQYKITDYHPSCLENLSIVLKKYGISVDQIPEPFNIFMNTSADLDGKVTIDEPLSNAGDYIELRAEMDLVVGIAACSAGESKCNAFKCTSIIIEIFR